MAEAVSLNYMGPNPLAKPPLNMGVRLRLSVMMFLEFAVWGSYFVVWNVYLGTPVANGGLGFNGTQIGSLYGTMALGAIVSMMFAGQLADRVLSSEYLMLIFHLLGAVFLVLMARIHDFNTLWAVSLGYALVFNPTLAVANSIAFANIPDATRDFPTLRVLGTIGWIAGSMSVDWVLGKGADATNKPLIMAAILSGVLAVFSLALPHTPPSGKKSEALPFLRAFKLIADPSFGIFFGISFVITIALAFYYNFASLFLKAVDVKQVATTMSLGQWSEIGFMLLLPLALSRLGMKWVLAVGMAAWAARYGLFSLGHPFVLLLVGVALHGVCFDFFLAAGFIHTDNKAPPSIRASAQALFSFLTYGVGMWIGNEISGRVVDHFTVGKITNWTRVWIVPAAGAAICLLLFMLLWRDKPGKLEEAEQSGFPVEPVAVPGIEP